MIYIMSLFNNYIIRVYIVSANFIFKWLFKKKRYSWSQSTRDNFTTNSVSKFEILMQKYVKSSHLLMGCCCFVFLLLFY